MLTDLQKKKWTYMFDYLDTRDNGFITKKDFENEADRFAKHLDLDPKSEVYNKLLTLFIADWDNVQKNVGTNKDGQISLDDWLKHAHILINDDEMYETNHKIADTFFDIFDQNGDDSLCVKEFSVFMKAWGFSEKEIELGLLKLNLEEGNNLSREQFKKICEQFAKSSHPDSFGNHVLGSCH